MNDFITHILGILKTNGFPEKRVSLPTEKMFEAADKKGFSFNKVIDELKATHQIDAQIGPDKIIFSKASASEASQKSPADMMKEAQEMMSKMNPEELRKIQEMFMNMTPEEKEEIMKKGKDLGLL